MSRPSRRRARSSARSSACATSCSRKSCTSSDPAGSARRPSSANRTSSSGSSAIALFYLPQAAVVVYLNRLMPLEGGLYQWATVGLGEFLGFLTAWNLWAYTILIIATFGVMIANNLGVPVRPDSGRTGSRPPLVHRGGQRDCRSSASRSCRCSACASSKWLQNIGGAAQILMFSALILVPFIALSRGTAESYHPLSLADAGGHALQPEHLRQDGARRAERIRVRRDPRRRVQDPGAHDRPRHRCSRCRSSR